MDATVADDAPEGSAYDVAASLECSLCWAKPYKPCVSRFTGEPKFHFHRDRILAAWAAMRKEFT